MEESAWSMIGSIGVAVTAVGAAVAAFAAWKSARAAKKTVLAQIIIQITDAYGSDEMLSGMQKLRKWQKQHKQDWVKDFVDLRRSNYPKVEAEDEARRRYFHHFYKIGVMLDSKVVDKSFVKKIVKPKQVDFLLEVIEPLNKGMKPDYDRSTFDTFRKMYSANDMANK